MEDGLNATYEQECDFDDADADVANEDAVQDEDGLWNKLCTYTITQKRFMNQHWCVVIKKQQKTANYGHFIIEALFVQQDNDILRKTDCAFTSGTTATRAIWWTVLAFVLFVRKSATRATT